MSVFRYKGSKVWTMEFHFHGQRIRESTGTRSKTLAAKMERNRRTALEEGSAGIKKAKPAQTFAAVAEHYLTAEKATLTPGQCDGHYSSVRIDGFNLKHLLPVFGRKLLCDITPTDMTDYQQGRLAEGAAPKTVNLELGTFRSITTDSGHWARLLPKISTLAVSDDVGIELSVAQQSALLEACSTSESRLLYPMVMLAIETGARSGTIKKLSWGKVDFAGRGLRWGKDKTKAGTGRTIPVSQRAMTALEFWATNFPNRTPTDYVFPSDIYRQPKKSHRVGANPYTPDPTRPVTSIETAWQTAKEKAGWILAGRPESKVGIVPLVCRFHDLRHTAVTRMVQAGVPIPVIAQLVGWSPSTMVTMAARYGHYSMDTLRGAVEAISFGESPVFHPVYPSPTAN
jgi:integrase